jgi:hypothetical protein
VAAASAIGHASAVSRKVHPLLLLALLALALFPLRTSAQEALEEPSSRDIVVAYNTGFRFMVAPGVFIPIRGGNAGFSLVGDLRYGFELGPTVLAPGARVGGYFTSGPKVFIGLATLRLTIPLGPVGPYVLGGVGPGYVSEPSETGLAYVAGGGFMVHIGWSFAIGAEATYQAITDTKFAALFIGPALLLSF